ncbi:hypothetical protein CDL15_Pgr014216 [Punica granatum]|uniref:Uncharacterized protein n=1 Tax=Punica granatum TaxID=22663 RepID=A0A218VVY7_PUNGR|nr:hypothetical protein CDL15_Pgr014216 [Punica granatum]
MHPSRVPVEVDTPKPRRIGFAYACPDEMKFGCAQRPKQDTSEMRSDASLVTLASGGIFRVPYWAPFEASVVW